MNLGKDHNSDFTEKVIGTIYIYIYTAVQFDTHKVSSSYYIDIIKFSKNY